MRGDIATNAGQPTALINRAHVAIALLALVVGTLVYLLDRPAESAPFFSAVSVADLLPNLFGRIGEHLPTFSHTFAFSLLTAAWLGGTSRHGLFASVSWLVIDSMFELGQRSNVAWAITEHIPTHFDSLPILQHAGAYFVEGTFDAWDLVSIALGAAATYFIVRYTERMTRSNG